MSFPLARTDKVPLATLPSKQGLKHKMPAVKGLRLWPLATLPSKQGLKLFFVDLKRRRSSALSLHFHQNKDWNRTARCVRVKGAKTLATLPSKQGLKLEEQVRRAVRVTALATLPSKQGLKHVVGEIPCNAVDFSRYTSIKTRIETPDPRSRPCTTPWLSLHFHQNKDWNIRYSPAHLL